MSIQIVSASKLSDDDEKFLKEEWAIVVGEQGAMSNSGGIAVTAKNGNATLGVAKGWYAGGVAYVIELMVKADKRGNGIGAQLLTEFEKQSIENGARRLALRVEASSPAKKFYEREGWQQELVVEDWLDGHSYLQMRKDLPL